MAKAIAYLGHAELKPFWEELNAHNAVVFVHLTYPVKKK